MRTPIALFLYAVAVRVLLVALYPDPAYPDSFYYVDVARGLNAGHGFNVDFIWAFVEVGGKLPAVPTLPIPSNAHWMPLASIVQLPFLAVLGTSAWVSAIPFVLIGSLAAPLTWAIAREAGARPIVCVGAGLLTAVPAASTVFMAQPDNFALYQPLGAAALLAAALALKGRRWALPLGGLLVGVATLARNDGVLLGLALAFAFAWDRWRALRSRGTRSPAISVWAAIACAALFLAVMAPWWTRQLAVFGSISPSTASGKILWLRQVGDLNSISTPATLSWFLGQGAGPLLWSRLFGLIAAIGNFVIIPLSAVLAPWVVVGAWLRRRSVDFGPFFAYGAILFATSALLFAVHVPTGMFLHSAVALVPHTYVLCLEGVVAVVGWVAARRRTWDERRAVPVFLGATVGIAILTGTLGTVAVDGEWSRARELRVAASAELDRLGVGRDERLMAGDTAGYEYFSGRGGVVTPNDPIDVAEQVARAYDVRWLILERRDIAPALAPVLGGTVRPTWIGAPTWSLPTGAAANADGYPDISLYPVCVRKDDTRCGPTAAAHEGTSP